MASYDDKKQFKNGHVLCVTMVTGVGESAGTTEEGEGASREGGYDARQ